MARVTISDCLSKVNNHFELVLVATVRAKEILSGRNPTIDIKGSKVGVVALREIAEGAINIKSIEDKLPLIYGNNEFSVGIDALTEGSDVIIESNKSNKLLVIEETDGGNLLSSD